MNTTLSGNALLALLVKHRVVVPVSFILEAGLLPTELPHTLGLTMSYPRLWQIASEGGCVVWTVSGVAERLFLEDGKVMAWGRHTRKHVVKEHNRGYPCTSVDLTPEQLWNFGGKPSLIPEFYWRVPRKGRPHLGIKNTPVPNSPE